MNKSILLSFCFICHFMLLVRCCHLWMDFMIYILTNIPTSYRTDSIIYFYGHYHWFLCRMSLKTCVGVPDKPKKSIPNKIYKSQNLSNMDSAIMKIVKMKVHKIKNSMLLMESFHPNVNSLSLWKRELWKVHFILLPRFYFPNPTFWTAKWRFCSKLFAVNLLAILFVFMSNCMQFNKR